MKMLFMTNVPSPYRVDFFNELGTYVDLTVLFEKQSSDERHSSWCQYVFNSFKGIFLTGKSIGADTAFCPEIKKYLKEKYDTVICSNFTSPTGMYAIYYMRTHHIRYYLESDGGFAKNGKGLKEKVKEYFIKGAEGYFSTGRSHDEYYKMYGAKPDKIIRYPFSSIHDEDILTTPVSMKTKNAIRNKKGISENYVVLTVGQFIPRKGFDVLLNAIKDLPSNIGIYFVGGIPTEEYLKIKEDNNLRNVHFVGFQNKKELIEFYKAADIFVLPTREDIWGLVINEAMAYGLPIITTKRCAAGLELVQDDVNGYIIDVEDEKALGEGIMMILKNKERKINFSEKSLNKIRKFTIETMVQRHLEVLDKE